MTMFDDNFWWQFFMKIFDDNFWQYLTILAIFDNFDNLGQLRQLRQLRQFWKDSPADLWHLRHWLQFWQLGAWIHDNLWYLTLNCDTGQHSQFLRCFKPSLGLLEAMLAPFKDWVRAGWRCQCDAFRILW